VLLTSWPSDAHLNRAPTWVEAKKAADAVNVVSPDNAPAVMVVALMFISSNGPSSTRSSVMLHDVEPLRSSR